VLALGLGSWRAYSRWFARSSNGFAGFIAGWNVLELLLGFPFLC
jgi:hypothetical protein